MINVSVIGFGYVGSSLTLLLLNSGHSLRINIMEPDPQCEGAVLDLQHSLPLFHNKEIHLNRDELFEKTDFVFHAAGSRNIQGESRLDTTSQNVELSREIFQGRKFAKNPHLIVITNPVDIISHSVLQFSGLPPDKVIGTGTFLDSIRLSYHLSKLSKFKATSFKTMVLGEHGDSQVPVFSQCSVNDLPLMGHPEFNTSILELAAVRTRDAATEIRKTQDGTTYGISKCAIAIMDYLLKKEHYSICLSMLTNNHYRSLLDIDQDIYLGLPVIIGEGKIEIDNSIHLNDKELKALRKSAGILTSILH